MKKYTKVVRHGKKDTELTVGANANVVIMEKLDGANASFKNDDGALTCFSRNQQLGANETLRGFVHYAQANVNPHDLMDGCIYFGEWLVKHKIDYGENANEFYLFDVYSETLGKYLPFEVVKAEADRLNLKLVPVFYEGQYQNEEHAQSFVGKSMLATEGEGIVIKNHDYKDKHGNQLFTKLVSDKFSEMEVPKKKKQQNNPDWLDGFVDAYLTKARVEKTIHKLVDEGVIDENYGIEDTGTVLKNSAGTITDDILEEEYEALTKLVRKKVGKKYPEKVREVLSEGCS